MAAAAKQVAGPTAPTVPRMAAMAAATPAVSPAADPAASQDAGPAEVQAGGPAETAGAAPAGPRPFTNASGNAIGNAFGKPSGAPPPLPRAVSGKGRNDEKTKLLSNETWQRESTRPMRASDITQLIAAVQQGTLDPADAVQKAHEGDAMKLSERVISLVLDYPRAALSAVVTAFFFLFLFFLLLLRRC
jgi:hypothetical protein